MTARGSYANGLATREEILEAGLTLISDEGYAAATLRRVSEVAGVSKAGLLHHFGTREQLLAEILWKRDLPKAAVWSAATREHDPDLAALFADFLAANIRDRNLTEFSMAFSTQAAAPHHPGNSRVHEHYDAIERELLPFVQQLERERRLANGLRPADLITAAIALMEGLQLRWLYDPGLDVEGILRRTLSGLLPPALQR